MCEITKWVGYKIDLTFKTGIAIEILTGRKTNNKIRKNKEVFCI